MVDENDLIFLSEEEKAYQDVYIEVLKAVGSQHKSSNPNLSNDQAILSAQQLLERVGIGPTATKRAAEMLQQFLLRNRSNPRIQEIVKRPSIDKISNALQRATGSVKQITAGSATVQAATKEIDKALKNLGKYSDAALRAEAKRFVKSGGQSDVKAAIFSSLVRQLTARPVVRGQKPQRDAIQSALGRLGFGTTRSPNVSGLGSRIEYLNNRGKGDLAMALVVSTLYKDATGLRIVDGKFVGGKLRSASEIVTVGRDMLKLAEIVDADNKPGTVHEKITRGVLQLLRENPGLWRSFSDRKIDATNIGNIGDGPPKIQPKTGKGGKTYYDRKNDKLYSWDQKTRSWAESKASPIQISRIAAGQARFKGSVFATIKNFEAENRRQLEEARTQVNRANIAALRTAEEKRAEERAAGRATREITSRRRMAAGERRAAADDAAFRIKLLLNSVGIGSDHTDKTLQSAIRSIRAQAEALNNRQKEYAIAARAERLNYEQALADPRYIALNAERAALDRRMGQIVRIQEDLKSGALLADTTLDPKGRARAIADAGRLDEIKGLLGSWKRAGISSTSRIIANAPKLLSKRFVEYPEPPDKVKEKFLSKWRRIAKDIRSNLPAFRGGASSSSLQSGYRPYRRPMGKERKVLRRSSQEYTVGDLPESVRELLNRGGRGTIFTYRTRGGVGKVSTIEREQLLRIDEIQALREEIKAAYVSNATHLARLVKSFDKNPSDETREKIKDAVINGGNRMIGLSRLYVALGGEEADSGRTRIPEILATKRDAQQIEMRRKLTKIVSDAAPVLGKSVIFLNSVDLGYSYKPGKTSRPGDAASLKTALDRYEKALRTELQKPGADSEALTRALAILTATAADGKTGKTYRAHGLIGKIYPRGTSFTESTTRYDLYGGKLREIRYGSYAVHPEDLHAAGIEVPKKGKPIFINGVKIPYSPNDPNRGWGFVQKPLMAGTASGLELGKIDTFVRLPVLGKDRENFDGMLSAAFKEGGLGYKHGIHVMSYVGSTVSVGGQEFLDPALSAKPVYGGEAFGGLKGKALLATMIDKMGRELAGEKGYAAVSSLDILRTVGRIKDPQLATEMMRMMLEDIRENMKSQASNRRMSGPIRESSRAIATGLTDTVINDLASQIRVGERGNMRLAGRQTKAVSESFGKGGALSELMKLGGMQGIGGATPVEFLSNLFASGATRSRRAYGAMTGAASARYFGGGPIQEPTPPPAATTTTRGRVGSVAAPVIGGAGATTSAGQIAMGGADALMIPKASFNNLLGIIDGIERLANAVAKMPKVSIPKSVTQLGDAMEKMVSSLNSMQVAKAPPPKKFIEMQNAINNLQKVFDAASKVSVGKGLAGATGKAAAGAAPNITINQGGGGGGGRKVVAAAAGGAAGGGGGGILMAGGGGSDQPIRDMQNFANQTSGILGNLAAQVKFGFVQQFTSQISQFVGSMLGHLQQGILGFNMKLENATVAFDTLFENEQRAMNGFVTDSRAAQDQAENLVAEIQRFANVTPFRFPELVESARRMRAFGFETNEILPNLQAIGDAVAALGGDDDKIYRITYALGQMKQAGRVYQNDMMQLANAGIAGYELLSRAVLKDLVKNGDITLAYNGKIIDKVLLNQKDAMGNSTDAAKQALADLTILTNKIAKIKTGTTAQKLAQVGVTVSKSSSATMKKIFDDIVQNPIQAIRKLTQSGKIEGGAAARAILDEMAAEFGGGMRKLSKTFQGALSTLQDTSQYFVAMITKPIYEGIRDAMIELGYFMQSRAAKEQAQKFAASFAKIIPTVGGLLQNILGIVTGLGKAFTEMFERFTRLANGAAAGADMLGLFLNGVQVLSDAMRNRMARAFVAAALGFKLLAAALSANKPLVMLVGIITAIGALGEAYEKNTFGFKSFVDEYAGPIQSVIQQMQNQLIPALVQVGTTMAQVFGGAFMETLKLAVPVFTMLLKVVNLLLTALNAIPGASNVLGAALAMYAGGKILGPALFGSKMVTDAAGNVVKSGSGGLLGALHGGARRAGDAGVALRAGEMLNQATFRATKAATSVAGVVKAQEKIASKILKDAVKAGTVTAEEAAAASAHYSAALQKAAATTTSVPQMVKMVGGGRMFRESLGQAQAAGRALAVGGGVGNVGSRMSAFIKDIGRAGASVRQFGASLVDFIKRIFMVLKGAPMAATAAGYGPGAGLLGLGSGVKGGFAAIKQTGFIKSIGNTVKSIGKIGGALALVSGLADVASGTDPVRAGARVVGGTIGGAIGATLGSVIPVFGTAIGGILGSLAGSFIGDRISDVAGVRGDQAGGAELDLTPAEAQAMSFNEALKDGVITMTELNRLGSEFTMTTPEALQLLASGINPTTSTLLADTYKNITSGLSLTPEQIKGDLNTLNVLTDVVDNFYKRQGKQNSRALAIAELSAYLDQAGSLKSVDALNNALKGLLAQWGISEDAARAYGLVISGAADDTQALADATNKAKEAMSTLASAMQSRVGAVFEKAMAKAKEKAIDAFLATQMVLVDGQQTNILALKKEIELQDKKNRLAEVEKGIRSATRNVEMARLALYDASVDPLEAAYRMREAEDAKTEELKKAALERKKIALDEAMASEPVKAGLEHIEELFEAAKMKFQEGMQHILDLVNKGKISGAQAAKMIAALYKTTLGEVGVLDANLDADARNFGDAFLGTWDTILKKFKKQVNELRRLLNAATDPGGGGPLDDLIDDTTTTPGASGPAGDWSTMPGGRAGDNWRGFGMDPAEIAAMNKAVTDAQKKNVAIRFGNMLKVLQSAKMPPNLSLSQQVGWPVAISRALAAFSYGGSMWDLFQRSQKTNDPIAVMKQFNAGKKVIDQIFFPYGKNNPVAGMASGGTIMGSGLFKVGEAGSEMMQIGPAGVARVFPRTYRPIGGIGAVGGSHGGVNASVIINNPTVRNDQDIRKLAEEVSRAQTSLLRSAGIGKV